MFNSSVSDLEAELLSAVQKHQLKSPTLKFKVRQTFSDNQKLGASEK